MLPEDYQGLGKNISNIPVTVTPDASVTQTSSSTPAIESIPNPFSSIISDVLNRPKGASLEGSIGAGLGKLFSDKPYSKQEFITELPKMKENLINSISDPNDKKKAEVLFDKVASQQVHGSKESTKDVLKQLASDFDSQWNNVNANIKVNLKPTKTSVNAGNAITDFVKRTASGSIITNQKGEETNFDPDVDYVFAGATITPKGVVFNMADKKNPTDIIQVQNNSDVGANSLVVNRGQLKEIDNSGIINSSPLLSGIAHLYPNATNYKVIADPNSPTLSSVVMLDNNGKQIDEPVPQEVLDQITIEAVAQSIGSVGTGKTPKFK